MYGSIGLECSNITECLPYFRMLFDSIRIGIIIADPDGNLVYYNNAQSQIDQLKPEQVLGRNMCEVYNYTPETSPSMQVLRTGKPVVDTVNSYLTRSGNLVNASCTIYPLYAGGESILGVICYSQSYMTLDIQIQNVQKDINTYKAASHNAGKSHGSKSFDSLIGKNKALQKAIAMARVASCNSSAAMLVGETGVGKEIFAQSIHYEGPRASKPYTAINCSAVPETLLEGILFGTAKGAFTGAMNKAGLFEVSHQGSIFLDEVDSMPISLQSKLLRALQEKRIRRVGEAHEREVDVRIISAVGRNPSALVKDGVLRPDFYYRLGVIKTFIPPLRERMDDLHLLVQHFLRKYSAVFSRPIPPVSPEAMAMLYAHDWPGNVRELEHAIEASISIMRDDTQLDVIHLCQACPDISESCSLDHGSSVFMTDEEQKLVPVIESAPIQKTTERATPPEAAPGGYGAEPTAGDDGPSYYSPQTSGPGFRLADARHEAEAAAIKNALAKAAGNKSLAARLLGISPQLLHHKLKKFKLAADDFIPKSL